MKLWLLKGKDNGPWEPWYDKYFGFVIRAETEEAARAIAAAEAADEGEEAWLEEKWSTCVELIDAGVGEIVLSDFHAA